MIEKFRRWIQPNLPTKLCPHRYCRQVHMVFLFFGVGVLVTALSEPLYLVYLIVLGVILSAFTSMIWGRKSQTERMMEEEEQRALNEKDLAHLHRVDEGAPQQGRYSSKRTVFPGGLVVHKGWARVAFGLDVFLVVNMVAILVVSMTSDRPIHQVPSVTSASDYIGSILAIGVLVFIEYAHRKATKTRKPRRQWFGAFGTQGSET